VKNMNKEKNGKSEDKKELLVGLLLLYFVICLFITAVFKKSLSPGNVAALYSPMLIVFIIWQTKRYFHPDINGNQISFARLLASVGMVSVILVVTVVVNIAGWLN
jgi:hypothetical protein